MAPIIPPNNITNEHHGFPSLPDTNINFYHYCKETRLSIVNFAKLAMDNVQFIHLDNKSVINILVRSKLQY